MMRMVYNMQSLWKFKKAALKGASYQDYYQAGQSVDGCHEIVGAGDVVKTFAEAALDSK